MKNDSKVMKHIATITNETYNLKSRYFEKDKNFFNSRVKNFFSQNYPIFILSLSKYNKTLVDRPWLPPSAATDRRRPAVDGWR